MRRIAGQRQESERLAAQVAGLIEALAAAPYEGKADLPDIAYEQELEVDELFPVAEAMQLLRLAEVEGGDIKLTHMGKRFADAEQSYRRAIALVPGFADAWNNLGTCLRELKRPEEAETVYRKALELGPNNPDTLDNLALALKDLERADEAAETIRRALVIDAAREPLRRNVPDVGGHDGTALEKAAAARAGGQHDGRFAGAGGAHQFCRYGFVAAGQ